MDFPRNLFIEIATKENHTKEFLENTLNYIENLRSQNLPVIFSLKHFAILLKIDYNCLKSLISNRNKYCRYYLIRKKKGGFRRIVAPHKNLKTIQNWIKTNILDVQELNTNATGFIKGKSILNNAKIHENAQIILNLDLENFFESINERRVYGVFASMGYAKNLSIELARLCTVLLPQEIYEKMNENMQQQFNRIYKLKEPILIQGAPTSPGLSNIICKRLDKRLSSLANKLSISYSRYADDLTFSGIKENLPRLSLLNKIIQEEGFKINSDKIGKFKKGQRQMVTGLLIDNNVRIPKKFKKEIYRHLHFCIKYGPFEHFNRIRPGKGYKKEWLLGKIRFVQSIEPEEAKKMYEILNRIEWEI